MHFSIRCFHFCLQDKNSISLKIHKNICMQEVIPFPFPVSLNFLHLCIQKHVRPQLSVQNNLAISHFSDQPCHFICFLLLTIELQFVFTNIAILTKAMYFLFNLHHHNAVLLMMKLIIFDNSKQENPPKVCKLCFGSLQIFGEFFNSSLL